MNLPDFKVILENLKMSAKALDLAHLEQVPATVGRYIGIGSYLRNEEILSARKL